MKPQEVSLTAEILESTREETTVRITCVDLDDEPRCDIRFTSRDLSAMRHRDRAVMYARDVIGTRSVADTVVALARAEIRYMPKGKVDLQFLSTCIERFTTE